MPGELRAPGPPALRRARAAVAACFFLNAVVFANLVPRYPEVTHRLALSNTAFGTALAAFPLGSLVAALAAGSLIRRFGSARLATGGLVLLSVALGTAAVAPSWAVLAAALLIGGAVDAVVDVAQNAHGLRVQRHYGRSILNAFHGVWSVGAVAGGLLGSTAAGLAVPLGVHLGVTAAVVSALAVLSSRLMLPGPDTVGGATGHAAGTGGAQAGTRTFPGSGRRSAVWMLAGLGGIAACGAFVEDAGASWSALYLRNDLAAGAAAAGLGFVALQLAMTIGRLTGDRVVDRFGQRRVARTGGAVTAVGMGLALAFPSVPATLGGFALAGLGVATVIPAVFAAADALPGLPHGTGLAAANWLLRIGFLVSPPLIGLVADGAGLRIALLTVVPAGLVVLSVGRLLPAPARRM